MFCCGGQQYRTADDPAQSCRVARMMILGKLYNARWSVERTRRDHALRVDGERFAAVSAQLQGLLPQVGGRDLPGAASGAWRAPGPQRISAYWMR